jgi:hypothetical protein
MASPIEHRLTLTSQELALVTQGLRVLLQQRLDQPAEARTISELAKRLESIYRARLPAPGDMPYLRR